MFSRLHIVGTYNIQKDLKAVACSGPDNKPYALLEEGLGDKIHRFGRKTLIDIDYDSKNRFINKLTLAEDQKSDSYNYLMFMSFDHYRMRILEHHNCKVLIKYDSRVLLTMNNTDSDFIYGVPKRRGETYRCWVDDTGTVCHEITEGGLRNGQN